MQLAPAFDVAVVSPNHFGKQKAEIFFFFLSSLFVKPARGCS